MRYLVIFFLSLVFSFTSVHATSFSSVDPQYSIEFPDQRTEIPFDVIDQSIPDSEFKPIAWFQEGWEHFFKTPYITIQKYNTQVPKFEEILEYLSENVWLDELNKTLNKELNKRLDDSEIFQKMEIWKSYTDTESKIIYTTSKIDSNGNTVVVVSAWKFDEKWSVQINLYSSVDDLNSNIQVLYSIMWTFHFWVKGVVGDAQKVEEEIMVTDDTNKDNEVVNGTNKVLGDTDEYLANKDQQNDVQNVDDNYLEMFIRYGIWWTVVFLILYLVNKYLRKDDKENSA